MANGTRFGASSVKMLLEMQEGEQLHCDSCKTTAVEGDEIWVFVPLDLTSAETCCLSCASAIIDDKEPFEVDQ